MLVLKCRKNQKIVINDEVTIMVTQTSEGRCSLGIEAPDHYQIRRSELPALSENIIRKTAAALTVQE